MAFPNDKSSTPKGLRMELKLELQISARAKSPLMELVSIKEDVGALFDLSGHDTCFSLPSGKYLVPVAFYNLSLDEKTHLLKVLKHLKVLDG